MEKKKQNVLLIIMGVLILMEIVLVVIDFSEFIAVHVCMMATLLFTALYGFIFYKKPHGNMLKYAMLIFAISNILSSMVSLQNFSQSLFVSIALSVLSSAVVCYGAGRLNRIKQNKILFPIICVVYFVVSILWFAECPADYHTSVLSDARLFSTPTIFLTLMIAYFVRYKEHKEAGISDK